MNVCLYNCIGLNYLLEKLHVTCEFVYRFLFINFFFACSLFLRVCIDIHQVVLPSLSSRQGAERN